MFAPSTTEVLLRWLQLGVNIVYPVVVASVLYLAWRDWHRWVNHQIGRGDDETRLAAEVSEFIE